MREARREAKAAVLERLLRIEFVRDALADGADLSAFRDPPTPRIITGLIIMAISYVIGWPVISVLGFLAFRLREPWLVAVLGPIVYGVSHLAFLLGAYLAGAKYTRTLLRWAARKGVERLAGGRPAGAEKRDEAP